MKPTIHYAGPDYPAPEVAERSRSFYLMMNKRRSVRHFSPRPIADEVIDHLILAAGTAPSGAHKQPWTFCVVTNPEFKKRIRKAAEKEERLNYSGRMSEEWIRDLEPLGTTDEKEFLEIAPALIVVFRRIWEPEPPAHKHNNYYVTESVGIACGFLLAAVHNAGLTALTHTPSPMSFLERILERPANERAFLLIPVGYPATDAQVPDLERKTLEEICVRYP